MTHVVFIIVILLLVAMNIFLWRTGSVKTAENPKTLLDVPVKNPKERKAFLKRVKKWKAEGKLTREEFETVTHLIESDWNA